MADSSPLPNLPNRTVEVALNAYNDGYRVIAGWFNEAFKAWKVDVRINADPPAPGVTLDDCRLRLSNALLAIRPLRPDLARDDELIPWVVGYVSSEREQAERRALGIGLRDHELMDCRSSQDAKRIVSVKHAQGWGAGEWRTYVIEPMDKNAASWRDWLGQFLSSNANTSGKATPKRRGRKPADDDSIQEDDQLAADWKQASDAGVSRADFARPKGLTVEELNKVLNRVSARDRRASKSRERKKRSDK